ncbi:MAG: PIN domain-containing protein [Candidatus Methanospirareceae archaeon]
MDALEDARARPAETRTNLFYKPFQGFRGRGRSPQRKALAKELFKDILLVSRRYALLSNDACIASFARAYGIPHIATNDPDFERVDCLTNGLEAVEAL